MCHEYGTLLPCDAACQKYNLTKMQWNCIVSAMPKEWKNSLQNETNMIKEEDTLYFKFIQQKKCTSFYYRKLNSQNNPLEKLYERWDRDENTFFNMDEFILAFQYLEKLTNLSKLRSFQYKMLYKSIILNDKLKLWKIQESEVCTLLKETNSIETLYHFYWQCKVTKEVWEWVRKISLEYDKDVTLDFSYSNIILNRINANPTHISNTICLFAKQYLYAQRCKKQPISYNQFKTNVQRCES